MKKIFAKFYSLLIICVMLFTTIMTFIPSQNVRAENTNLVTQNVIYGAIVRNNPQNKAEPITYSSVYSVANMYKKEDNNPANREVLEIPGTVGVSGINICDSYKQGLEFDDLNPLNRICDKKHHKTINPILADVSIEKNGNVTIRRAPNTRIKSFEIYYIIYSVSEAKDNSIVTSNLFCKNSETGKNEICPNAKKITQGNWKQKSNINNTSMRFNEETLETYGFKYSLRNGMDTYSDYNILDHMDESSKTAAKKNGAFVTFTLSLQSPYDKNSDNSTAQEYYLNKAISHVTFKDIKNIGKINPTADICQNTYTSIDAMPLEKDYSLDNFYKNRIEAFDGAVNYHAGLIYDDGKSSLNDDGAQEIMDKIDTIIKPIIYSLLGALLIVRGTMLGVTIVKSSDDPEVRSTSIKHLVTLFVSVLVIFLILYFYRDIYDLVKDMITK